MHGKEAHTQCLAFQIETLASAVCSTPISVLAARHHSAACFAELYVVKGDKGRS